MHTFLQERTRSIKRAPSDMQLAILRSALARICLYSSPHGRSPGDSLGSAPKEHTLISFIGEIQQTCLKAGHVIQNRTCLLCGLPLDRCMPITVSFGHLAELTLIFVSRCKMGKTQWKQYLRSQQIIWMPSRQALCPLAGAVLAILMQPDMMQE